MWTPFSNENGAYMIRVIVENPDSFSLWLTDLKSLWSQVLNRKDLAQIFNVCNPAVHLKMEEAVLEVLKLLEDVNLANVSVVLEDNMTEVEVLKSKCIPNTSLNIDYKLKLHLQLQDKEKFMEMVTIPLIQTISYMEKQQQKIYKLLHDKDNEIEAYKIEKGIISRDDLITERFEENENIEVLDKFLLGVFSKSPSFLNHIFKKHGDVANLVPVETKPGTATKRKRRIHTKDRIRKKKSIVYKNAAN